MNLLLVKCLFLLQSIGDLFLEQSLSLYNPGSYFVENCTNFTPIVVGCFFQLAQMRLYEVYLVMQFAFFDQGCLE